MRAWSDRGVGHRIFHGGSDQTVWPGSKDTIVVRDFQRKGRFPLARIRRKVRRVLDPFSDTILAVISRDIFLAKVGRTIADVYGVPLVLDLCDNYPEVALQLSRFGRPWLRVAVPVIGRVERRAIALADQVVCVTEESRAHIARKQEGAGGAEARESFLNRSQVIENVPWAESDPVWTNQQHAAGLVYIGTFDTGIRDLATVLDGLRLYERMDGHRVVLNIYTFDPGELRRSLDGHSPFWPDYIRIRDPVPSAELPDVLSGYMAGVVPHHRGPGTDYTISNKIFDYLWAGIPVLATDNPPNVRVLRDTEGGMIYRSEQPMDFAVQLKALCAARVHSPVRPDPSVLREKYSWQRQVHPVIDRLLVGSV